MKIRKIAALLLICITVTGCTGRHEIVTIKEYQDVTVVPYYTDRIELDYDKSSPRKYLTYCKEYPDLVCRNPGEWYTDDGNPEYPYVIKGQNLDAAEIKAASLYRRVWQTESRAENCWICMPGISIWLLFRHMITGRMDSICSFRTIMQ